MSAIWLLGAWFQGPVAPAARRVHHAYVGGLLEQISEMLALAEERGGNVHDLAAAL